MKRLDEDHLAHDFPDEWEAEPYDRWSFYRRQFQNCCGGNKAVDFLAYDPGERTLWLVEIKDYRQYRRSKDEKISLWDEVATKVRDTLAGLFAVKVNQQDKEALFGKLAARAKRLKVVLHLEQPVRHSKLFPRAYNPADVQQKLKQIIKPIDAHPHVIELNDAACVPWSVVSI